MMRVAVILPAAGRGSRFRVGQDLGVSKIEQPVAGRSAFLRAIDCFAHRLEVVQILLAVDPDEVDAFSSRWEDQLAFLDVTVVAGGRRERWQTVQTALTQVDADVTHIAVHDAARCVTPREVIDRVFEAAGDFAAVVPGLAITDTLKRVETSKRDDLTMSMDVADEILGLAAPSDGASPALDTDLHTLIESVEREGLWSVQTPQVFEAGCLKQAYAALPDDPQGVTDDAEVVQRLGGDAGRVVVVPGDRRNLKITHPEDLELAEAILEIQRRRERDEAVTGLLGDDDDDLL